MVEVAWTPAGLSDLFNICTVIGRHSETKAEHFAKVAFDKTDQLSQHPQLGEKLDFASESNLRKLIHGEYIIVYSIETDAIWVLTVVHGSRDLRAYFAQVLGIHLN